MYKHLTIAYYRYRTKMKNPTFRFASLIYSNNVITNIGEPAKSKYIYMYIHIKLLKFFVSKYIFQIYGHMSNSISERISLTC